MPHHRPAAIVLSFVVTATQGCDDQRAGVAHVALVGAGVVEHGRSLDAHVDLRLQAGDAPIGVVVTPAVAPEHGVCDGAFDGMLLEPVSSAPLHLAPHETREVRFRTHDSPRANCAGSGQRIANCGETVDVLVQVSTDHGAELFRGAYVTTYQCRWRR